MLNGVLPFSLESVDWFRTLPTDSVLFDILPLASDGHPKRIRAPRN